MTRLFADDASLWRSGAPLRALPYGLVLVVVIVMLLIPATLFMGLFGPVIGVFFSIAVIAIGQHYYFADALYRERDRLALDTVSKGREFLMYIVVIYALMLMLILSLTTRQFVFAAPSLVSVGVAFFTPYLVFGRSR